MKYVRDRIAMALQRLSDLCVLTIEYCKRENAQFRYKHVIVY